MTDVPLPRIDLKQWPRRGLRGRMEAARAETADANERLRSILASVSDCYFTLDRAYRITDLNNATVDWAGAHGNRVLGACLWDLSDPRAECSLVIRESMEARRSLQDEERQRIAGELHDSTAQHLAGLVLHLMRLRPFVMPEGHKVLDEAADSAEEAARELRAFTYLLHPPGLENGGLAGTVRAFAAGFARRTGLQASVSMPDAADNLPFDIQRSLLRVIQEALTNTYRHAAATRVLIDLRVGADTLKLRVFDDGCGLSRGVRKAAEDGALLGVGVTGMRARMVRFGGSLRLLSDARGTLVSATLPS